MPNFLSKSELCENLGISLPTCNRQLKAGKIPSVKVGARVLIPSSFLASLEKQAVAQEAS